MMGIQGSWFDYSRGLQDLEMMGIQANGSSRKSSPPPCRGCDQLCQRVAIMIYDIRAS
jgi:hypothetical protein